MRVKREWQYKFHLRKYLSDIISTHYTIPYLDFVIRDKVL